MADFLVRLPYEDHQKYVMNIQKERLFSVSPRFSQKKTATFENLV